MRNSSVFQAGKAGIFVCFVTATTILVASLFIMVGLETSSVAVAKRYSTSFEAGKAVSKEQKERTVQTQRIRTAFHNQFTAMQK